jgi:hypothetical protein
MVSLISLPVHILVDITSYLDLKALKVLSPLHSILREVCDIHLFRRISLPLLNVYRSPSLATSLKSLGWKDDIRQTGHLDASIRYLAPLLESRAGFAKELSLDLKYRYHDIDLDLDELTNPIIATEPQISHVLRDHSKPSSQDPNTELDILRLQASLIRQSESPLHLPHLVQTFALMPILPAVRKVRLVIYESFPGYLPYLFALLPNLTELVLEPHELLVESPLSFASLDLGTLPKLKKLRVEPMLNCLRVLVGDLLKAGVVQELILGDGRWTMDEKLARVIRGCRSLKTIKVGKQGSRVLLAADQRI